MTGGIEFDLRFERMESQRLIARYAVGASGREAGFRAVKWARV
jgi:hypothetical protein